MLVPILAVLAVAQAAQPPVATESGPRPSVAATRALQAPEINGRDDDPVWRLAPKTGGFRQFEPKVNGDPTYATEFQVAYDTRNLYVFVRMHDPHPDSIMHALSRRDVRGPSDQIKLIIDSYDDKRSGYEMAVNPDGVKRDFSISNDNQEDGSWNGIWDVATTVDANGWTAEFRVPLSQMRYASGREHTFGFGIWRDLERLAERSAWPEYSPVRNGLASQLGRLTGLVGISSARNAEVTPYAVTKNQQRVQQNRFARDQQLSVGADLKLGITPNVTLDATVNPDFGQVEADPAVLNLSAFEVFVAEQRPFFVEGTGLYRFQLNCYIVVDCGTNEGLFYSRRIGRSPALRGVYGDNATVTSTPIAAATKLTGRTGSGLSFGALGAVTPRVKGGPSALTVEPGTSYGVLRAQQDFRGGEAGISLITTIVDRSLDSLTSPYLHRSAYATGLSFRNRFHKQQYELAGQLTASQVNGSAEVIARTQRNAVHFYQQPGDDLEVDTTRTSLSGYAGQLKFGKYGGGITRFETSVVKQSAGFDVNDLGFLRRADVTDWSTWAALSFRNARGIYRWAQVNANHWERWNTSGERLDDAVNMNGHMGFMNNWNIHLGGTLSGVRPIYCDRCTRGGPTMRVSRAFYPWAGLNTDSRKVVSGGVFLNLTYADDGNTTAQSWSPYVNLRFSTRMQLNIGSGYSTNRTDAQWFANLTDGGTTHYTFARLDQRTVSMNVRLNYTVTPEFTLEFYGQPFTASGEYTNVREVSATPHAEEYAQRFQSYTLPSNAPATMFRATQLRTNTVARWEYRPGSTLFLVWAHGRDPGDQSQSQQLRQSWSRDYRDLFSLHPNNTFLVKFAYWLNR